MVPWHRSAAALLVLLAAHLVLPQSPPPPSTGERVIKCAEQKDASRARKLAMKQTASGKLDKAEGCARAVLRIRGDTASAADWEQLGIILNHRGKMQGAVNALKNAVARDDRVKPPAEVRVERRLELANALLGVARPDDAMEQYRECAMLAPNLPGPFINGGNVHLHRGNFPAAEHFYRTALQLEPTNFDAIVNLGALMAATARGEDAVIEYRRALALDPDNVDALSNLGSLQMDMGDVTGGLGTFQEAFKVDDSRAPLCYNMANAYLANGQVQEAIDNFERAISLDPMLLSAKCTVASLLAMQGRYDEAKSLVREAAEYRDSSLHHTTSADGMWRLTAQCLLMALHVETGDWGANTQHELDTMVSAFMSDILGSSRRSVIKDTKNTPEDNDEEKKMRLRAMSTCLSPSRALYQHGMNHHQALIAAIYFSQQADMRAKALPRLLPTTTQLFWEPDTKLGVGYVFIGHDSNEQSLMDMLFLSRHATAHDGRRLSHCYSLRSDKENAKYLEIKLLCGRRFHDLSHLSHSQAAKKINSDGIHILVDTVGHSYGGRPEVLALQPSALQIEVKPMGTHGTARVLISDRIVTPPEYLPPRPEVPSHLMTAASAGLDQLDPAVTYTETVVMLPSRVSSSFSSRHHHNNLHQLPLRTDLPHRRRALRDHLGLPNDTMIYAYVGRVHAITDESLQAWVTVLQDVVGSVLLLPDHPPGAREILEKRTAAMGLAQACSLSLFLSLPLSDSHTLSLCLSYSFSQKHTQPNTHSRR